MIKINRLKIENFQSHQNTELKFSDGLNVIVGPSDQGKSAIIRSIKWVLYNEPRGNDFIRQGTNFARVLLELSNGYIITRERTPSKNRYTLEDPEGNVSIFEGFGNEVPLEVVKAHGIPKVVLDTDVRASLNIGEQLEGPFLLSQSGATRAKAIGRLTGLHIIDRSIRDCATDIRRENQTCDRVRNEIEDIAGKLEEYNNVIELGNRLEDSGKIITKVEVLMDRVDVLVERKNTLKNIETEHFEESKILSRLDKLEECSTYLKGAELGLLKLNQTQSIKKRYSDISITAADMEKMLKETSTVNEGIELLKEIFDFSARYAKLNKVHSSLVNINSSLDQASGILDRTANIKDLDSVIKSVSDGVLLRSKIALIRERLVSLEGEIAVSKKNISSYENARKAQNIVDSIDKKLEDLNKLEAARKEYSTASSSLNEGLTFLANNKREIQENLEEYTNILRKNGICPLCKSSIGDEKLENIIRHYEEVH